MTPAKKARLVWALKEIISGFIRAAVIAWALDALRPDLPWIPHLSWWGVWLVLLVLGTTVGDLTGSVLVNVTDWLDRYGAEPQRQGDAS